MTKTERDLMANSVRDGGPVDERGVRATGGQVVAGAERVTFTINDRDTARFMLLDGAAVSQQARELSSSLAVQLYVAAGTGKRGKATQAFVEAVAAIVSDHLRNAEPDAAWWGYCSHRREAFTGKRIGDRVFKATFRGMKAAGLLDVMPGHQQYTVLRGQKVRSWAKATRSRATAALLDRAALYGITPANHNDHFKLIADTVKQAVKNPLEVRRGSVRVGAMKYKGFPLPLDLSDPIVTELYALVVRINAYFSRQEIGGLEHRGFKRVFNDGGGPDYGWDKGGRLSSVGANSYQNAKKAARAEMTINGEAVVEIDITASHLTILHALAGQEFDPVMAYMIDGVPRDVIKSWVTMTLGHSRFHKLWPAKVKQRLEAKFGQELKVAFPIAQTRAAIMERVPLLRTWENSPIGWADLQFIESQAIIGTVKVLAFDHDVPGLPVHDSIIVPASKAQLAERVLSETFRKVVGVDPQLKRV